MHRKDKPVEIDLQAKVNIDHVPSSCSVFGVAKRHYIVTKLQVTGSRSLRRYPMRML